MFSKPLRESLIPPSIPVKAWQRLGKKSQQDIHERWRKLVDDKLKAESALRDALKDVESTPGSASSSSAAAAGATRRISSSTTADLITAGAQANGCPNTAGISQLAMLMMTILGTTMTGAADRQRFQEAVNDFFAKLHAEEDVDNDVSDKSPVKGDTGSAVACPVVCASCRRRGYRRRPTPYD